MENDQNRKDDFQVRLPMRDSLVILQEVGSAFKLLLWLVGRVTIEFQVDGFRVGGVLGFGPYSDRFIARDVARCGIKCTEDQVFKWRNKLAARGLICQFRTPYGHRLGVMHSVKFPHKPAERLPDYAAGAAATAFARLVRAEKVRDRKQKIAKIHAPTQQNHEVIADCTGAVRLTGLVL